MSILKQAHLYGEDTGASSSEPSSITLSTGSSTNTSAQHASLVQAPLDLSSGHSTQRRVRFAKRASVRFTGPLDDMTDDELYATWYAPEDFQAMKRRETKLAGKAQKQPLHHQETLLYIYGVETPRRRQLSRERAQKHTSAILQEQRQCARGEKLSTLLASVSHDNTRSSRHAARERAFVLAQHILNDDKSSCETSQSSSTTTFLRRYHTPPRTLSGTCGFSSRGSSSSPSNRIHKKIGSPCPLRWSYHGPSTTKATSIATSTRGAGDMGLIVPMRRQFASRAS